VKGPLAQALERLREEFPNANLRDARLAFRFGERAEFKPYAPAETWNEFSWSIQIDNNGGNGKTVDEAISEVKGKIAREALIPERATRIADILRELEYHDRYAATEAAQRILDEEPRHR
jgi:hypothetical protein